MRRIGCGRPGMKSQFHVDRGTCSTAQETYDAAPAREIDRPQTWSFVGDFQGMAGDGAEPDAQFFVETWTLGAAAAVENFKQRRQELARSSVPARHCTTWTIPQHLLLSKRARCMWISSLVPSPLGTLQRRLAQACRGTLRAGAASGTGGRLFCRGGSLSPDPAERVPLLGVAAGSTLKQIKAAYRQRVSQWHPRPAQLPERCSTAAGPTSRWLRSTRPITCSATECCWKRPSSCVSPFHPGTQKDRNTAKVGPPKCPPLPIPYSLFPASTHCSKNPFNSAGGRSQMSAAVSRGWRRMSTLKPRPFMASNAISSVKSSPK